MQQLQLDSNQIFHSPFFHFALHPPPMWLEAAVRTIEAALPFFSQHKRHKKSCQENSLVLQFTHAVAIFGVSSLKSARDFCRLWPNNTL